MTDKPNYEVFTTPVGELVYPWLSRADTRYNPEGLFHTKLLLPFASGDTQELIARLELTLKDFVMEELDAKKQKTYVQVPVYQPEVDDDGNETTNVVFNAKLKAVVTPRDGEPFTQDVKLRYAEDGGAVEEPVYGGTMAKLKGQIVPYTNAAAMSVGVTMRLRAVQVHELQSGGGAGAFWTDF